EAAPDRLGFQETGGASAPPAPPALRAAAPVPAAPVPAGVAQAAEAIADPELRKGFMDVAARYLARAAGADSPREKGHA
ncbi:MAG TPA: hypothetical protein VFO85_07415, partial [Vicinamibacteria bacterium]|nr:hypothetical protein [Vicinamibacteria bacterium]